MKLKNILSVMAFSAMTLIGCNGHEGHDHEHEHAEEHEHEHDHEHEDHDHEHEGHNHEHEGHNHEHEGHEHEHEHEEVPANCVKFSKAFSKTVDFTVEPVTKQPLGKVIRTVAQILPSQGDEIIISAKADGVITLSNGKLNEGCAISAGQAICSIDASVTVNNNLSVQQSQAQAEYNRAKTEYDRLKSLREDKLVLESEVTAAKAAYESAEAALKGLKKNFGAGTQSVSSPRSGYLKQLLISNGQFVSAGQPVAVITQSKTLRMKAQVQASYFADLKEICGANIRKIDTGAADSKTWTLEELGGKVISYGRQTDITQPLIPVTFEVNNVQDFLPGTFMEMFILTRSTSDKVTVPAEGVLEEQGNYFVYVQVTPELFEKRQVKIGVTDGKRTEVISGVKTGEKIVAHGAILVKLQGATGNVDPHSGHSHAH